MLQTVIKGPVIHARVFQPHRSLLRPFSSTPQSHQWAYFTLGASTISTKDSILHALARHRAQEHIQEGSQVRNSTPAAALLVSPQHASWLYDEAFLARVIQALSQQSSPSTVRDRYHLLAAVVDGVPPLHPDGMVEEGLSFAQGSSELLLPDLWNVTDQDIKSSEVPSSISILSKGLGFTLPLANTLFSSGRRSTMLATEWSIHALEGQPPEVRLSRSVWKQSQVINISGRHWPQETSLQCFVTPVTEPRVVSHALGNIVSKVDVEGQLLPASEELQKVILSRPKSHNTGPVLVWALVIPPHLALSNEEDMRAYGQLKNQSPLEANNFVLSMFKEHHQQGDLQPEAIGSLVKQGCRLVRVLGGGGEWGAKAGLISLDPEMEFESPSEAESLESFQRSFQGDSIAAEAIVNPGDIIQFFSQIPSPRMVCEPELQGCHFGLSGLSQDHELQSAQSLKTNNNPTFWKVFGGYSTEGLYLSTPHGEMKRKLDVPSTQIIIQGE